MTTTLTQQWLRQQVNVYAHQDRVYSDIDSALARFQSLRPKTDQYTYDDGRTQLLLCVHGLLPITFKQASYNIPIAIWITREYPRLPPIAYVVPTNNMLVKAGRYMEVSGRCHVEYLQHWERKSEGCHLIGLLEAMQDLFGREPPVYAKPKQLPSGTSRDSTSVTTPSPDPPQLPPKPFDPGHRSPIPRPDSNLQHPLSAIQSPSLALRPPPPLPPNLPSHLPPHYASAREATPNYLSGPQVTSQPVWSPPLQRPELNNTASPPAVPAYPSAITPALNLLDDEESTSTLTPPVVDASAPPRPPNPELVHLHMLLHQKFSSELASLSAALTLDGERLRAQQTDLLAGEPAIRDEMARLEAVRDVSRNVAGRLKQTVEQAESNVSYLRRKGDPEVDELVCSTSIVHNQLINLVAEDNAIEDTMYHLHRALNSGRIDLERFLRTTRVLAEGQFMKRALIEKIHAGMPI